MPNIPSRHHGTAEELFALLDERERQRDNLNWDGRAGYGGYSQDSANWHGREGWGPRGPAIGTPGPGSFPHSSLNWHAEEGWRGAPAMGTPGGYAHGGQVGGFYPMWGLKGGYSQAGPSSTGVPGAPGNPTMDIAARQRMLQQQLARGQSGPMDPSQALAVQMLRRRLMGAR